MITAKRWIHFIKNKRATKDKTCGLLAALQSKQQCERNKVKIEISVASQKFQKKMHVYVYITEYAQVSKFLGGKPDYKSQIKTARVGKGSEQLQNTITIVLLSRK